MELHQFEQKILQLAFETESRITTASIAYYLGIPSREANLLLNSLLEEGTLELDSDMDGNLFYTVPNHSGEVREISELKKSAAKENAQRVTNAIFRAVEIEPADVPSPIQGYATLEADVDSQVNAMSRPQPVFAYTQRPSRPNVTTPIINVAPTGLDGSSVERERKPRNVIAKGEPIWRSVATRAASTDGTVGVGSAAPGSSFLISTTARCDARPIPAQGPVIAECDEQIAGLTYQAYEADEDPWFGPRPDLSMVTAGETAMSTYIEQPEHQPGMALLLSLILCGTGQIYNGELSKGVMMMVLCFLLWLVLLGWVVHIWSIVDAVVVAERMNRSTEVPT